MTELERALADIATVRDQMARSLVFRGYGPQALAATGLLAGATGVVQWLWLERPDQQPGVYIALWSACALIAVAIIGLEAWRRSHDMHTGLADLMLAAAAEKFLPTGVAGLFVTAVLFQFAPDVLWLLPGLWQVLLSLGVFAACSSLPRLLILIGFWYLSTGLAAIAFAQGVQAFSPLAMALPLASGQLLAAGLLHHAYRGHHAEN